MTVDAHAVIGLLLTVFVVTEVTVRVLGDALGSISVAKKVDRFVDVLTVKLQWSQHLKP